jgi:hypothetical protein
MRLKVPGVRFHELGWKEPLWRIGIAWHRNSEKLPLISRFVKVVQGVVGDQNGLVVAQRSDRIDPRRASRGKPRRHKRHNR